MRFRNPDAWSRAVLVNGIELQLTDREWDGLCRALDDAQTAAKRGGYVHGIGAVAYFLNTGVLPNEGAPLAHWRRQAARVERRKFRATRPNVEQRDAGDAADLWEEEADARLASKGTP